MTNAPRTAALRSARDRAVLAVLAAWLVACAHEGGSNDGLPVLASPPTDVVRIQPWPVPEGSPGPPFVAHAMAGRHEIDIRYVRQALPDLLPAPSRVPSCGGGVALTIGLANGEQLEYGACDYPHDFPSLSAAIEVAYEQHWPEG